MKTRLSVGSSLLLLLQACVSSYDPQLRLSEDLIVVTGVVTDQATPQAISLNWAHSSADSSSTIPLQQAHVEVLVDGTPTLLLETQPGTYAFPRGFRGQPGRRYQLRFRTSEGASYQSTSEVMAPVPPIQTVYDVPSSRLITVDDTLVPATDIYLNYQDPAPEANFYLWRWREYEVQAYCASCKQGRYVIQDLGPAGSGPLAVLGCVVDPQIRSYTYYDYPCRGQCWDIFYNTTTDVFSDIYTNGKPQVGHLVATIPAYQANPAVIVIEQLSLSPDAFRYYKLFADQVQNTGTLADAPPAPLAGNVHNDQDPRENVVGYFSAASVATYSYKFTRQNLRLSQFIGLFRAQMHRLPKQEENRTNPIYGSQRPSALCLPGLNRTDQVPPGW